MPKVKDFPESIEVINFHCLDRDVNATYLNHIVGPNPDRIIDDQYGRCSDETFEEILSQEGEI